jgi:Ca-activated chloride channel family protein
MHRASRYAVTIVAAMATSLPATVAEACTERAALLMLDASYSMKRLVTRAGTSRFNVAREALSGFVDRFPPAGYLALRFYGSEHLVTRNHCQDSQLVVPFAPAEENIEPIKSALAQAHARGVTPLAYALEQAGRDFPARAIERLIVIVSDGLESCGGNPCAAAASLGRQGFVINTVGFLADRDARRQLQCIADATGGQYFHVSVTIGLQEKLEEAFAGCPIAVLPAAPSAVRLS